MDISKSATDSTPQNIAGFSFFAHRVVLPTEPCSFFLGEYCARKSKSITVGCIFYAGPIH